MSVKTATNTSTCSSPFGGARRGIPPYPAPCFFRICVYQPVRISVFTVPLFQKTQNLVRHGVPFSASLALNRVLTHVAETLLFPSMHWGLAHSVGHYVDLWSAALGLTLFPLRYFLDALTGATRRSMAPAWVLRAVPAPVNPRLRLYGKAGIRKCGSAGTRGRTLAARPLGAYASRSAGAALSI
jgi:hypothetical protein